MDVVSRFLRYISTDTTSRPGSTDYPSTPSQRTFGQALVKELRDLDIADAGQDAFGTVYVHLPATSGYEQEPALGLISHMDTSPDAPGAFISPRIITYTGGDILLNPEKQILMRAADFPSLSSYIGQELIVTDGTTLLGADDKAGVAEIITALAYLQDHPEIPHGPIAAAFTPDEEIGCGTDHFDLSRFGCAFAYTVDGGQLGEIEYENFNAASAVFRFHGVQIHPGSAKDKMRNAILMAQEALNLLPPAETPAHTEDYEGFYHVHTIEGRENQAHFDLLVRDHDRESFEKRKAFLQSIVQFLQDKYGPDTVELDMTDSYYNMKDQILPHPQLIQNAKEAMKQSGVTPHIVPIRGGTDGARLSYLGLPCPNLSTGGLNFHGIYEYIPVDSLKKMTEVLVNLLRRDL